MGWREVGWSRLFFVTLSLFLERESGFSSNFVIASELTKFVL